MLIDDAQAQAAEAMNRGREQNSPVLTDGVEINTAASGRTKAEMSLTMDAVISRKSLMLAYQRVVENKGAAGVDMDLEKFFDRVDYDILMLKLARTIKDKRSLKLIRCYLEADMVEGKEVINRDKGMPQGMPLSPLLSNILLDELDKELERRGHNFCRYADDCNIYVSSQKAGEHTLKDISEFLMDPLKLQVNVRKSAVARPWERNFLGYSFTRHQEARVKIAPGSIDRLKDKIRNLTTGNGSKSVN